MPSSTENSLGGDSEAPVNMDVGEDVVKIPHEDEENGDAIFDGHNEPLDARTPPRSEVRYAPMIEDDLEDNRIEEREAKSTQSQQARQ